MIKFRYILLSALLSVCCEIGATELSRDAAGASDSTAVSDSTEVYRNMFGKILDYFKESNTQKPEKKFDFSVIGGPHYSSDTKLGLGLVAAGIYRTDRSDSITMPSNVSLYGDVSTVGFYLLGIRGNHIAPRNRSRIDYKLYFYSFPTKFWGIGYDMGNNSRNETSYKDFRFTANVNYMFRLADALYIGPGAEYNYIKGSEVADDALWMWNGERLSTSTVGVGLKVVWDSRDNLTAPTSGLMARLEQRVCPRWLGNHYPFSYTEIEGCLYNKLWEGAVLATRLHARVAYGTVPWSMLSSLGGSFAMRGYYDGRYRDKGEADLTLELRQHIWHRIGAVAWVGAGNVFPSFDRMRMRHTLPNFGLGYRWEFKKNTNVRLDYGFGKSGQSGFIFNINEAF